MRRPTISVEEDLADAVDALAEVHACAEGIISQTGVRRGNVHIIPKEIKSAKYT